MAQLGPLGGPYRRRTSQQFGASESGMFRRPLTATFQGCGGIPAGARLHCITSACLPARRASSLLAPLLKGKFLWSKPCQETLLSDLTFVRPYSWGAGRGGDFCWETRRAPPLALTTFNEEESGVRKTMRTTPRDAPSLPLTELFPAREH